MNIQSVIPQPSGLSTTIWAIGEHNSLIPYNYSHSNELIRDPKKPTEWLPWNGGSLTDAIQFVISL